MKQFVLTSIAALLLAACGSETTGNSTTTPQPTASSQSAASEPATVAASSDSSAASTPSSNQTVVRVVAETYVPFTIRTPNGAMDGFDYDLLTEIAKRENLHLQFIPQSWAVLFGTLEAGNAEIAAGGIYATEERKKRFDVTEPYLDTGTILLVGKDKAIKDLNDVRGKTITVKKSTVAERTMRDFMKDNGKVETRDTLWLAVKDVLGNQADAVFGDAGALTHYAARFKNDGITLVTNTNQPTEHYAFLVKKGNTELLNKLNKGLAELKKDGTYDKLHKKWFEDSNTTYAD